MRKLTIWLVLLLIGCGGGGGSNNGGTEAQSQIEIADRGFADRGIFTGVIGASDVLLVLDAPNYFLLAGDLASQGTYSVNSVDLEATGRAYRIAAN